MSSKLLRGYRFTTEAQWNACMLAGVDRDSRKPWSGLRPFAPYAFPARFASPGGWTPTTTCASEVVWRDDQGMLQRLPYADDKQHAVMAPWAIARAARLVATSNALWAPGNGELE